MEETLGDEQKYLNINQAGVFNAGFLAIARSRESHRFLEWWQARCRKNCYIDLTRGIFVDQKWLDFVPALFEGVLIDRNLAMNVGHWNLVERDLRIGDLGKWVVGTDQREVIFFHFSGFDPRNPGQLTKHDALIDFDTTPFLPLLTAYSEKLNRFHPRHYLSLEYGFGKLPDGTEIKESWREAVRCEMLPHISSEELWSASAVDANIAALKDVEDLAKDQRILWRLEKLQCELDALTRTQFKPEAKPSVFSKLQREFRRLAGQVKHWIDRK